MTNATYKKIVFMQLPNSANLIKKNTCNSNCQISKKKLDFCRNSDQNYDFSIDFWLILHFFVKISIFVEILIFGQHYDFWQKVFSKYMV